MRTHHEVWQWSSSSGEYTKFLGQYETREAAESIAAQNSQCIVVAPTQVWTPFRLNGKAVSVYPIALYLGGRGHNLYFSVFDADQHIGFVKPDALKTKDIDPAKVAYA